MDRDSSLSSSMDVIGSVSLAMERCKAVLFKGFEFATWLRFGVIIFIASLAGSGVGVGGLRLINNLNSFGDRGAIPTGAKLQEALATVKEGILEHMAYIVLGGLAVFVLLLAIALVVAWLGCRGQMMLIRAVATGSSDIGESWNKTMRIANSAWVFRGVLTVISFVVMTTLMIFAAVVVFRVLETGNVSVRVLLLSMIKIIVVFGLFRLLIVAIQALLIVFVMPIMYKDDVNCLEGWRRFFTMSNGNLGQILLLLVVRAAYYLVFIFVASLIACVTCCIGGLPVVSHTIFAPFFVFDRAFTMHAIQSTAPEYNFFEDAVVEPGVEPEPEPDASEKWAPSPTDDDEQFTDTV